MASEVAVGFAVAVNFVKKKPGNSNEETAMLLQEIPRFPTNVRDRSKWLAWMRKVAEYAIKVIDESGMDNDQWHAGNRTS